MAGSRSSRSATAVAVSSGRSVSLAGEESAVPLESEQRSRLLAAKARALVSDHLGISSHGEAEDLLLGPFPNGAAVRVGSTGYVLVDGGQQSARSLGPALVWAHRHHLTDLHLMADAPLAAVLARRAQPFASPPRVWSVEGRTLMPARPAELPAPVEPSAAARELVGLLRDAGAEVSIEHGVIRGEVLGLEVARVVTDEGGARLEVGVGRHDREAFAMVHGSLPTAEALTRVVERVSAQRRAESEAHPLRHLVPEGWLRARVLAEPTLVGAAELVAVEPTLPRESVKDSMAAMAVGRDAAGAEVVVACSVGIDLDLVPSAADTRQAHDRRARLVIVVPERDRHPVTVRLAAALAEPAEVIGLTGEWRAIGPVVP